MLFQIISNNGTTISTVFGPYQATVGAPTTICLVDEPLWNNNITYTIQVQFESGETYMAPELFLTAMAVKR